MKGCSLRRVSHATTKQHRNFKDRLNSTQSTIQVPSYRYPAQLFSKSESQTSDLIDLGFIHEPEAFVRPWTSAFLAVFSHLRFRTSYERSE